VVNEPPVVAVATTPPPLVAVVRKTEVQKSHNQEDCTEYASLINEYDWDTSTAMNVCKYESRGNPNAVGDGDTEYVSCGLMQIRTISGRPSCEELKDPKKNMAAAYRIWKESGWSPWSVCGTKVDC
jgi:hypothetical protein